MTARLWGLALLLVTPIVNWLAFVVIQTETSGTVAIAHVHDCTAAEEACARARGRTRAGGSGPVRSWGR